MARMITTAETPTVVAARLSELLLRFPSAAAGGVQWQTLIRKYNERFSASLGIAPFGHSSALAAATALLWDSLRLVDTTDTDNPIVAVEDHIAMAAIPGAPATWPSLYRSLCEIVSEHGAQQHADRNENAHAMLVSQLKPLLQRHWHSSFDEGSLSYLTEDGTPVRMKKMKHLLEALLRWREQRLDWRVASQAATSAVDASLSLQLELVPSKKHNDLLLRCVQPKVASPVVDGSMLWVDQEKHTNESISSGADDLESVPDSLSGSLKLMQEIATLRAENMRLRENNCFWEQHSEEQVMQKALFEAEQMQDVWDSPYEPPPFEYWGKAVSPSNSTSASTDFGFASSCATPHSAQSQSGMATPTAFMALPPSTQIGQVCTMVPVWFTTMGDRCAIPSGMVDQARAIFECHKALPSQLLRPAMSCPGEVRMC